MPEQFAKQPPKKTANPINPNNKAKRKPNKNNASRRTFVLDEDLKKLIRKEARELNLSEEEFLRLMLHFSEVVRTEILPAGLLDGGILKMLIANPMVLEMLKNMVGNMMSQFGQNKQSSNRQMAPAGPALGGQQTPWGGGGRPGMPGTPFRPHPPGGQATMRPQGLGVPYGGDFGMGGPQQMWGAGPGMPSMGAMPGYMGHPSMQQQPHPPQNQAPQQAPAQEQSSSGFSWDGLTKLFMQFMGSQ